MPRPETIRMISTPKVFCLKLLANFFIFWRLLSTISRNMEATGRTNPLATWAKMMTARGLKLKAALKQAAISPCRSRGYQEGIEFFEIDFNLLNIE